MNFKLQDSDGKVVHTGEYEFPAPRIAMWNNRFFWLKFTTPEVIYEECPILDCGTQPPHIVIETGDDFHVYSNQPIRVLVDNDEICVEYDHKHVATQFDVAEVEIPLKLAEFVEGWDEAKARRAYRDFVTDGSWCFAEFLQNWNG